jgi:phosphocarrier protein FPr/phosphocarrier protein
MTGASLVLTAPLAGWATGLQSVPDPVFAEQMLGDGVAIDPTGSTLHAPCDAEILSVHRAGHAVTLRAANGAVLVLHVGLETVALGGEGFEPQVRAGDRVRAGDLLLKFDLDLLARRAKSVITPIVVTNGAEFRIARRAVERAVELGDFLFEVIAIAPAVPAAVAAVAGTVERGIVVAMRHGIHARPAATLSAAAKRYAAELVLRLDGRTASLRSPASLLALGVGLGAHVVVEGRGPDAEAAVEAVAALISSGMGEAVMIQPAPASPAAAAPVSPFGAEEQATLRGVIAAPGLGIGIAYRIDPPPLDPRENADDPRAERTALQLALARVQARLVRTRDAAAEKQRREILAAHVALVEDSELLAEANGHIAAGRSAGRAWQMAIERHVAVLSRLDDARLRERAADLRDLERQVLAVLAGVDEAPVLPDRSILVATELLPMQLALLDRARIEGICTEGGGPTSHMAILAAAAGIPAIVAAGPDVLRIPAGARLVLDADRGLLRVNPDPADIEQASHARADRQRLRADNLAKAHQDAHLLDGIRIEVFANLGSRDDVEPALANGAEGCGLLRTEFLFLDRDTAPDEDEQVAEYQAIATALGGRKLIVRTLDAGADKPLAFLHLAAEENPALGVRGIRVGLRQPEILRTQLRAVLRVRPIGQCRIMLPMIASLAELRAVRTLLDAECRALDVTEAVELGIMVETPAAAILAEQLAAEADFLSIGTNDLTQYVLAMDRMNPTLAGELDALHPAVLRMIAATAAGGIARGKPVGMCGGLASEPLATPLLIGLGVTELSANSAAVPDIKAELRVLRLEQCRALAAEALALGSAYEIRRLLEGWTP